MTFASDNFQGLAESEDRLDSGEASPGRLSRWFVVQVASGCEKKVKADLEQRCAAMDITDRILQVEIPQTPVLKPQKTGKPKESSEKVFPGYILIQLACRMEDSKVEVDEDAWQVVRSTPNVINFVGAEQRRGYGRGRGHVKPVPLSASEVQRIFKQSQDQKPVVKIDMAVGDHIIVLTGPFKDFTGEVIEVSPERSKLKALLSIFGRDTPVELEFNQVEKES